jgi:hypothetical protein
VLDTESGIFIHWIPAIAGMTGWMTFYEGTPHGGLETP